MKRWIDERGTKWRRVTIRGEYIFAAFLLIVLLVKW